MMRGNHKGPLRAAGIFMGVVCLAALSACSSEPGTATAAPGTYVDASGNQMDDEQVARAKQRIEIQDGVKSGKYINPSTRGFMETQRKRAEYKAASEQRNNKEQP